MNKKVVSTPPTETGRYRDLQILDELSNNDALTQRDLSKQMGIALGLVNSYLKNLIAKGYITVKNIPSKRYAYYLTPNGFAEKTRLAYDLLHDYTRIYREAKNNYQQLFFTLEREGIKRIVFAGADEVAEIAYIILHKMSMELVGVIDNDLAGGDFFELPIKPVNEVSKMQYDCIVITSYIKRQSIYRTLLDENIQTKLIRDLFPQ